MDLRQKRYAEYTKYPELFSKVYWGRFAGKPEAEIISNRNLLAEELQLAKVLSKDGLFDKYKLYDHAEYYESINGERYLIQSPYCGLFLEDEKSPQLDKRLAYTVIKPIYAFEAISFISKIKNSKDNG
jgi:hypothetical protein